MNIAEKPATNPGSRSATIAAPSTPIKATVFGPSPPRPSSTNSSAPRQTRSPKQDQRRVDPMVARSRRSRTAARTARRTRARRAGSRATSTTVCRAGTRGADVHAIAAATCSGVSQPGPNTRVICGANTRESPSTVAGSPSATTSPPASITTRVATAAASSTSCVAKIATPPSAACDRRKRGEPLLRVRVDPARGLVEQQHGRVAPRRSPRSRPGAAGRPRGRAGGARASSSMPSSLRIAVGVVGRARARGASTAPRRRPCRRTGSTRAPAGTGPTSTPGRGGAPVDRAPCPRSGRGRRRCTAAAWSCRRRCVPSRATISPRPTSRSIPRSAGTSPCRA